MRSAPIALTFPALMLVAAAAGSFAPPDSRTGGSSTSANITATAPEAPAGFDGHSNGFAEEFCRNQNTLVSSPNSPKIPADECSFDTAEEEFIGPETVADG